MNNQLKLYIVKKRTQDGHTMLLHVVAHSPAEAGYIYDYLVDIKLRSRAKDRFIDCVDDQPKYVIAIYKHYQIDTMGYFLDWLFTGLSLNKRGELVKVDVGQLRKYKLKAVSL